ncbi:MAG: hypothetical protein ABL879_15710 [Devosia sp.]
MKKILVAAAMVVAFATPHAMAADMAMPAGGDVKAGIKCFFLPLLPECVEYWKAKREEAKMKWEGMKG